VLNHGTHFEQIPLENLRKILEGKTTRRKVAEDARGEQDMDREGDHSDAKHVKGGK